MSTTVPDCPRSPWKVFAFAERPAALGPHYPPPALDRWPAPVALLFIGGAALVAWAAVLIPVFGIYRLLLG